ncbi:MAG: haloacid dehalogenase-like hydrolase [Paracoccaceae bacterium]
MGFGHYRMNLAKKGLDSDGLAAFSLQERHPTFSEPMMDPKMPIRGHDLLRDCPGTVLAVDLDGTLILTDMLRSSLGGLLRTRPLTALPLGWSLLRRGRPGLKQAVAARAPLLPAQLPYNPAVIALVRTWRAAGRKVVLATAADSAVAQGVAAHLGLFDAIHASGPGHNLKGRSKASFLVGEYGARGFVYAGDSRADLHVWQHAAGAALARSDSALQARLGRMGIPVQIVSP